MEEETSPKRRGCLSETPPRAGGRSCLAGARRLVLLAALSSAASITAGSAHRQAAASEPPARRSAATENEQPLWPTRGVVDPNTADLVTLEQLLDYADSAAPSIQTARARAGMADAEAVGAGIAFPTNPEISFGAGGRTTAGETGFEYEIAIQQQFEIGGERHLRLDAARDRLRLADGVVDEVRWTVHVEVRRLFMDILLVRERRAQAERFVAFSQSMRDVVSRQIDAGESPPLILLVADADLAQTREAVIEAELAGQALEARLAAVIGWPEPTLPRLDGALPDLQPAPDVDTLLAMMAEHHPSLRTRELAVTASQSRLALENREAWPEPSIGLTYGREAAPGPEATAEIWMLHVSLPVPALRRNQQGRALAEAEVLVAQSERHGTSAGLRAELLQAVNALEAAIERVSLYASDVVPHLESNLASLQRAYELGEVDVHDVSQTRARLLSATGQYIDARIAYYQSAAALEGLVGIALWQTEGSQ